MPRHIDTNTIVRLVEMPPFLYEPPSDGVILEEIAEFLMDMFVHPKRSVASLILHADGDSGLQALSTFVTSVPRLPKKEWRHRSPTYAI
jgi:hypothetical protein